QLMVVCPRLKCDGRRLDLAPGWLRKVVQPSLSTLQASPMLLLVGACEQHESQCDLRSLGRTVPGPASWLGVVHGINDDVPSQREVLSGGGSGRLVCCDSGLPAGWQAGTEHGVLSGIDG